MNAPWAIHELHDVTGQTETAEAVLDDEVVLLLVRQVMAGDARDLAVRQHDSRRLDLLDRPELEALPLRRIRREDGMGERGADD